MRRSKIWVHRVKPVCPSIRFGKENLSTKERGVFLVRTNDRVFLPLTKKYLWKAFSLAGGKNPGTAGDPNTWWPLPSVIESGFSQVFVYELLPGMAAVPNPTPTDDPDFADNVTVFPEPGVDPTQPGQSSVGVNQKGTGTIGGKDYSQRHFVCVVMSLICNTERADFEPGALVGMGRTIPHLQILSSKNVEKGEAVLELQRPNRSGYYGTVDNSDGVRVMNHPDMDVNVGALLVTDTNAFRGTDNFNLVNLPYWDLIFDYIAAENLPSGNVTVVDRLRRGTRKVAGRGKERDRERQQDFAGRSAGGEASHRHCGGARGRP